MWFSITSSYLNSLEDLPKISSSKWLPRIESIDSNCEVTKQKINDLLDAKTLNYILTEDWEGIVVWKNQIPFSFSRSFIIYPDSEIEILPHETVTIEWDAIFHKWIEHNNVQFQTRNYISIIEQSAVTDLQSENKNRIKWEDWSWTVYLDYSELDEEAVYENATIWLSSMMEITSLDHLIEWENIDSFLSNFFTAEQLENEHQYLELINDLFYEAKNIFENRAKHLVHTKEYGSISKCKFTSKKDIVDFLNHAKKSDYSAKKFQNRKSKTIHCTLLKYMYLLNDFSKNNTYRLLNLIESWQVKETDIIRKLFQLPNDYEIPQKDARWVYTFVSTVDWIEYSTTFRIKNIDSLIQKALAKWEYLDPNSLFDIIWTSSYLWNKPDSHSISILRKNDAKIFSWLWTLKNKNLVTSDLIESHNWNFLDLNEKNKYLTALKKSKINTWTNDNYKDAKVFWRTHIKLVVNWNEEVFNIWAESKVLQWFPEEESNEIWLSFHPVYDYISKFFEWEKNRVPFVTATNLQTVIMWLFEHITSDSIKAKYPNKSYIKILEEIYTELKQEFNTNDNVNFPITETRMPRVNEFFESRIAPLLFRKLIKQYSLERANVWNQICFTTKENRKQLAIWISAYEIVC